MNTIIRLVREYCIPVGLYCAVVALVFGRAILPGTTEMIWGDDIHRAYYFYRQFFNNFLTQGIWPWWNPYVFAGEPFMANPIVNILYPPSWLYVVLPLHVAYSWHIALHLLWAMLGMYCALRAMLNAKCQMPNEKQAFIIQHSSFSITFSSWIAGLVFGLSGFFTARIWAGHVDVIAAASWMPWVVCAFGAATSDKGQATRKTIVVAGVALAMQLFAGYQTMAMLTMEAVGIMTVIMLIVRRAGIREVIATMGSIAVSVLLAVGLFAVVLTPQQEYFRSTIRTYTLPYSWNAYGSLTWQSLGQFLNPFFFGDQISYRGPPPNFAEHAFFVGRGTLLLLLVAMTVWLIRIIRWINPTNPTRFARAPARRANLPIQSMNAFMNQWRIEKIWFVIFSLIATFGLWVSLGPNAPIDLQYILWNVIPMYHYLRIPPRHLILVVFGLSGVIGIAMNVLNHKSQIPNHKQITSTNVQHSKRFGIWNFLHFEFVWNLMLGAWNLLPSLFVLLIAAEMILYARHFIVLKPIPETRHDREIVKIFKQDKEPYRVLTNFGAWAPPRDSFDFDAGMNYGVFNATGYDTMILKPYYAYIDATNGAKRPSILEHDVQIPYLNVFSQATDILNIKYILHPRGYDPLAGTNDPRFRLIREDIDRDYRLYENTSVLPRFYFEHKGSGTATITNYSPNEIVLTTSNPKGDILASSEMYYPGWEGFIDGKKADVLKANNTFRALFVPAGQHTVVYRYNPRIFIIGGAITLISAGIMAFLWKKSYDIRTSS